MHFLLSKPLELRSGGLRQDARTFYAFNWSLRKTWRDNGAAPLIYYPTLVVLTDDRSFLCHPAGEGAHSSSCHSHRWWVKSSTSWRLSLCKSRSLLDICWLHVMQPEPDLTHGFPLSMLYTDSCLSFLWVSGLANDTCTLHALEIGVENVVIAVREKKER